jgi:diguanylate cyclase (GGDEF)-like protein/PAS domain S-box-containing protein
VTEGLSPSLDAGRVVEVLDGVEVLVYVKDLEGRLLYLNKACADMLGHPREGLLGHTPPAEVGEADLEAWRAQDLAVLESGVPLDIEETVGDHIYLTHKVPLFDAERRGVAVIGVSTEITERKLAEERLRRSFTQFAEAQQIAGVGSWHWDDESREVTWSPELLRIVGVEPGAQPSAMSAEGLAFVHPDDRVPLTEGARAAMRGERALDIDVRIIRADSTQRIVHCRGAVTRGPDGAPRRLDGTCVDVTDARHAHARLADAQRLAQLGSWDLTLDTDEVIWSQEMYAIFGVAPEHFIPTPESIYELIVPEDREHLTVEVAAARNTDGSFDSFARVLRPGGDLREVRFRGAIHATPGNGPRHMFGICQDLTDMRQNQLALAEAVELFSSSFERAPVGMSLVGLDGSLELVNQALCEFHARSAAELCELSVADLTHPDDRAGTEQAFRAMLAGERSECTGRKRYVRRNGEVRWAAVRALIIRDAEDRPLHFLVITHDITERQAADARRAARHAVASAMARGGPLHDAFPQMLEGIGRAMGWARGSAWLLDQDDRRPRLEASWRDGALEEHPEAGSGDELLAHALATRTAVARTGEGLAFPLVSDREMLGAMMFHGPQADRLEDELSELAVSLGAQIGEFLVRKRAEEQISHQALHDPLTGLPNRILFFDRLDQAIRRMRRGPAPLAILFLDFDGFKEVNNRFGHEGGDAALRRAAARVAGALRVEDTVGRFGGDEFVILTEHVAGPDAAKRLAERILGELVEPIPVGGEQLELSASIGVCISSGPDQTREELLRAADAAMYRAKQAGGGRFVIAE